jgi:hypothetical protein
VAVERSGQLGSQWGLRKESTEPSLAIRRNSFSIDEATDPKAVAERKQSINSELSARKSNTAITETIPETAVETPPVELDKKLGYVNGNKGWGKVAPAESKPSANPDKKTSVEERNTKLLPGDTISSAAVSGGAALNNAGGFGESLNGNTNGKIKPIPFKDTSKAVPAGRTAKPLPISTAPSSTTTKAAPKSTKSPAIPKTPTTLGKAPTTPGKSAKALGSKPAASSISTSHSKPADMKINKSTASTTTTSKPTPQLTTSSTVASTSENKPPQASPSTGFHKPKPKSPTRPAKLPSSMTAPTASSLSKVSAAAVSSRQSLAPATKTVSRSPSHASLSQKQELRRKPSKLDGDRPALGKPSTSTLKKQASRQSLPKQTAPTDESFLARMMRPTTSSASKTTEKIVTPPRAKTTTRPTTREGPASHKPHQGLKGSPSAKKLPSAAEEVKKEGSSAAHAGGVEDPGASASGIHQAEVAPAKDDSKIPSTTEDEAIAMSSTNNRSTEEMPAQEGSAVAADPVATTETIVDAEKHVEQPITSEEPESNVVAAKSVGAGSGAAALVTPGEPEESTSKTFDPTVNSEQPIVLEEQKVAVPIVDITDFNAPTNSVSEELKDESKAEDTVTDA